MCVLSPPALEEKVKYYRENNYLGHLHYKGVFQTPSGEWFSCLTPFISCADPEIAALRVDADLEARAVPPDYQTNFQLPAGVAGLLRQCRISRTEAGTFRLVYHGTYVGTMPTARELFLAYAYLKSRGQTPLPASLASLIRKRLRRDQSLWFEWLELEFTELRVESDMMLNAYRAEVEDGQGEYDERMEMFERLRVLAFGGGA